MREILFRGKRVDNGEWIVGHLLRYEDGRASICESHSSIFCLETDESVIQTVSHKVDPSTVGQYTGLTDATGNKIFEGDVVKYIYGEIFTDDEGLEYAKEKYNRKGVVEYKDGGFYPRPMREDVGDYWYSYGLFDFEVIGNIHDNPELIDKPIN